MEKSNYLELFRFHYDQQDYPGDMASLFTIEPTDIGADTLKDYKLHFRELGNGFLILAPCLSTGDGLWKLVQPFTRGTHLAAALFLQDQSFFKYTDLPFDPPGEYVYYLNNLDENLNRTLALLGNQGVKESDKLPLHEKKFSGALEPGKELPRVYDINGDELDIQSGIDLVIDENLGTYELNLDRWEDGVFTVVINETFTTYYCVKASFIRRIPFLIVEIFTGPAIPPDYSIVRDEGEDQIITPKEFSVHLGKLGKSVYWRYRIHSRTNRQIWIMVRSSDGEVLFLPGRGHLNYSDDVAVFTSDQTIAIPSPGLEIRFFIFQWGRDCAWNERYKYCEQEYGIFIEGEFVCRKFEIINNRKQYQHKCPARCMDDFIALLPHPDEVSTEYVTEGDKQYAVVSLLMEQANGKYVIRSE